MNSNNIVKIIVLPFLFLLIGCAKDDKGGGGPPPPIPPPPGVVDGTYGSYQGRFSFIGHFKVRDHGLYRQYLKDQNICEPPGTFVYTIGPNTWDCDNYSGLNVQINLDNFVFPTTGFAQIYTYYQNQYLVLKPSLFHGEFSYIDQNTGIELLRRGYDGTPTYNAIIRYRINGIPSKDSILPLEVYYRNGLLGTATLTRAN